MSSNQTSNFSACFSACTTQKNGTWAAYIIFAALFKCLKRCTRWRICPSFNFSIPVCCIALSSVSLPTSEQQNLESMIVPGTLSNCLYSCRCRTCGDRARTISSQPWPQCFDERGVRCYLLLSYGKHNCEAGLCWSMLLKILRSELRFLERLWELAKSSRHQQL